MAFIFRRGKSYSVVYRIYVDGVRKQKWEAGRLSSKCNTKDFGRRAPTETFSGTRSGTRVK